MDKLGKFLQRDLVNASPSRFLMDDVKENEMASSLPQNVTADYVRAIGSDGKSYRIPKADFASIIRSELGTILNGLSDQQTVTKVPTLNGNTLGASAIATLASVLGVEMHIKNYIVTLNNNESYTVTVDNALVYVVCNGDWKLVALSYNNITEIAGRSGERFSLTGDNTTFTITSSYSGSLKFGIFVFYRG